MKKSILTINGGSSSIKFAFYDAVEPLKRGLYGALDRIGLNGTNLTFHDADGNPQAAHQIAAADYQSAANSLVDWFEGQGDLMSVTAVGHRLVHGMKHTEPELVTPELLDELHRISPCDPDHLPGEIKLIDDAPVHFPNPLLILKLARQLFCKSGIRFSIWPTSASARCSPSIS